VFENASEVIQAEKLPPLKVVPVTRIEEIIRGMPQALRDVLGEQTADRLNAD